MLYAIRNNKHILENEIIEQATSSQGNAFLKCNVKPAPDNVPPSAKESQKVLVPSAKEIQKVPVSNNKKREDKNGGCVPTPSELESSFEKVAKSSLEKEFEALGIGNEFELLVQQAHEEEEMEDKLIEDMAAVS